jgi:hypothetical protein
MRLLVIGHAVEDHIITNQKEVIKPGGIYFTVLALTSIIEDDDIYLCTFAEKENYPLFAEVFNKCKPDFISFTDSIPRVTLSLHGEKERDERYSRVIGNLNVSYERLNEFDGILINMVSGFDVSLDQLKKIRQNYKGLIYLDVHTLSRGVGHHGDRDFKKIENFKEWAQCIDIIQVNENEVYTLSQSINENDIAREILNYGAKQLIITMGKAGAKTYYLQDGELNYVFCSSVKVDAVNHIGLGDVFEAVYFYNYIKTGNLFHSLDIAVKASGLAASHEGLSKLKNV